MAADVVVIMALCLPVLAIGFGVGVRFATGLGGVLVFIGFSALWGLVFTGFPYAVALKTGSPAAVNACFVLFFPLFFLTDAVVPKQELTGWFSTIATYNPITYLLGALRSLITSGWQAGSLAGRSGRPGRDRPGQHDPGPGRLPRTGPPGGLTRGDRRNSTSARPPLRHSPDSQGREGPIRVLGNVVRFPAFPRGRAPAPGSSRSC